MNSEQIQAWLKERADAKFFVKAFPLSVKVLSDQHRVLRFAVSDERRDRDGDVVRQLGLDTSEYAQNPVVFMGRGPMHANSGFPVARSVKIFRKYAPGSNLLTTYSDDMFAGKEGQGHDEAELAYALARDGFLNTASIGFGIKPSGVKDLPDDMLTPEEKAARDAGQWVRGYDIRKSVKYEHTIVGIPSNVGATIQRSLAQYGIVPGDRTVADFVEVGRKYLKGAKLDTFRQALIGERELITIGAFTVDKAPANYRESLTRGVSEGAETTDPGFDTWEEWVGVKSPDDSEEVRAPAAVATKDFDVKDAPMEIQTLIFAKSKFPKKSDATKWAKDHKFKADEVDETKDSWRLRQFDPALCEAGGERTIAITDGVKAGTCKKAEEQGEPDDEMPTAGDEKASAAAAEVDPMKSAKALDPDPEPDPIDDPPVAPIVGVDAALGKDATVAVVTTTVGNVSISEPIPVISKEDPVGDVERALIADLLRKASDERVNAAEREACITRARALARGLATPVTTPTPITLDAIAERFEKALAREISDSERRMARLIEDALIELELHKDNAIFAAMRGATKASAEPTRDPACVAKDASPPAAVKATTLVPVGVAVPGPQAPVPNIDPRTIESLVPALVKALNIEGIVEQVIYRHRGGITLPQGE